MAIPFSAFLPLIGQGVNAVSNLFTNKSNKNLSLEMYDRQRADALADWNRQNQYNSPSAQMARFKEAGLSPHLIYGQTNTAPPVRSSSLETPKNMAPQIDSRSLDNLAPYNIPLMQEQYQNIQRQGKLIDAQVMKTMSEVDYKNLQNRYLTKTFRDRVDSIILGNKLNEERGYLVEEQNRKIDFEINKIVADTSLSEAKKAEVSQTIKNLKQNERLLGEKVKTEEYLNSIQQKLQSMGIVGSTLAQILRLFK